LVKNTSVLLYWLGQLRRKDAFSEFDQSADTEMNTTETGV
jgi:hypothetical protein